MKITYNDIVNNKGQVIDFLLQEGEKMKEGYKTYKHPEKGYRVKERSRIPEQQRQLCYYSTGTTSNDNDYVEIAYIEQVQRDTRNRTPDLAVVRITNKKARLPAIIEYCKRAGMQYAPSVRGTPSSQFLSEADKIEASYYEEE